MSDLIDLIKNERFDFECPECRKKIKFKGKDIDRDVVCPKCKTKIHLDGKDFKKQMRDIEKQLDNLFK